MSAETRWSVRELSAAVEAYLQMLALEQRGEKYNKAAVERMLLAGPIAGRSTTEQRMQNISHVLDRMGRPWINGYKPLSNMGARTFEILQKIIEGYTAPDAAPLPLHPPVPADASRKLPPTGYWMFVCNRKIWDGEAWLRRGEDALLYKVTEHNHAEMQVGDLGIIRINAQRQTRSGGAGPAAVYALVEVIGVPKLQADASKEHYVDEKDALEVTWRAPLKVLANLVDKPILVDALPDDNDYRYLRKPLIRSTISISRNVFAEIYNRSGIAGAKLTDEAKASTAAGVRMLEGEAASADPKRKARISRYIERGPIGKKVKALRGCRCQVCEALGKEPIAFRRKNGSPYAEAHHVQPVALLLAGSLAAANIMVLCPNHHCEAHYGDFEVVENSPDRWRIRIGPQHLEIPKTMFS